MISSRQSRLLAAAFGACFLAGLGPVLTATPESPPAGSESASEWRVAHPSFPWSFPRDHWSHDRYRTEWWYFTGHLADPAAPDAPRFGFQFTLFRVGLVPGVSPNDSRWMATNLIMGHASITDLAAGKHYFSEILWRECPLLGEFSRVESAPDAPELTELTRSAALPERNVGRVLREPAALTRSTESPDPTRSRLRRESTESSSALPDTIAWALAPPGTSEPWSLIWNGRGFEFSMHDTAKQLHFHLSTEPEKPLIFQGPNGFSRKGRDDNAASQYYSFTRLHTKGTLSVANESFTVTGTSWMDKEFGSNQLTADQVGWDWFSLQLDNGCELMLYLVRRQDGTTDFARGTWIDEAGTPRYLEADQWSVEATGRWRSSRTGATYPSGWRVRVPAAGVEIEVRPLLDAQENVSERAGGLFYWEGAVEILAGGGRIGQGYVELTGYGVGNRPPI